MKTKIITLLLISCSYNAVSGSWNRLQPRTKVLNSKNFYLLYQPEDYVVWGYLKTAQTKNNYPDNFEIDQRDFEKLLSTKQKSVFKTRNAFLSNSIVTLNSKVNENLQLKVKFNYFKNAHLIIQINGKDSKQIFIISDDNSVFYTGVFVGDKIVMKKCQKDDLFVE